MRFAAPIFLALLGACMAPQPPSAKAVEAARDLNTASRFGRMDIAIENTSASSREHFMKRRSNWGKEIRVVDVQLSGMQMPDAENAIIYVDFNWMRMSEGQMRSTRIMQRWKNEKGWKLVREKRASGDIGLFGEPVVILGPKQSKDVHFATRSIR